MSKKSKSYNYILYGTKSNADDVLKFIEHVIKTSRSAEQQGRKRIPVCIWGHHGIGKTELVEGFAKKNNFQYKYVAPAQFEEMGDMLGMPKVIGDETVFVAPEWVPTQPGPGILLIDDVNRADDRILRGIMQLLQNYELVSWKLPPDWHIVLTANPDGGDYSVTPMDDAMLTRMMHVTMEFDVKAWAKWASGAGIDQRGIAFVLMYPEIVQGERTTPRTLVQFFESISNIYNLKDNIEIVTMLADACLDASTTATFLSYVHKNLKDLIWPEEILDTTDFPKIAQRLENTVKQGGNLRMDILSTVCNRLSNHLTEGKQEINSAQLKNLQSFLLLNFLPNDIRLGMLQEMIASRKKSLEAVLEHPEVQRILLAKM